MLLRSEVIPCSQRLRLLSLSSTRILVAVETGNDCRIESRIYPFSPNAWLSCHVHVHRPGVILMLELHQDFRWLSLAGMDGGCSWRRASYAGQPVRSETSNREECPEVVIGSDA